MKTLRYSYLGLSVLTIFLFFQSAHAQMTCDELFKDFGYEDFIGKRETITQGRLHRATSTLMLLRLKQALPEGDYEVRVNGGESTDILTVQYNSDGDVAVFLSKRELGRSKPTPLKRSTDVITLGDSFGIETRVQHLPNQHLLLANTVIRGNEHTPEGLSRREIIVDFGNFQNAPVKSLTVSESSEIWWKKSNSTSARKEPQLRIEIVQQKN